MSSAKNVAHLFVYGTLREEVNHPMSDLLQKYTRSVCSAIFQGKLFDAGSFPAAVPSDTNSDTVHGELYTITDSDAVFRHLDPYEGYTAHHPSKSLFIRKKVSVETENKNRIESWIYLYNRSTDKLTPIPEGDYLNYLE